MMVAATAPTRAIVGEVLCLNEWRCDVRVDWWRMMMMNVVVVVVVVVVMVMATRAYDRTFLFGNFRR